MTRMVPTGNNIGGTEELSTHIGPSDSLRAPSRFQASDIYETLKVNNYYDYYNHLTQVWHIFPNHFVSVICFGSAFWFSVIFKL